MILQEEEPKKYKKIKKSYIKKTNEDINKQIKNKINRFLIKKNRIDATSNDFGSRFFEMKQNIIQKKIKSKNKNIYNELISIIDSYLKCLGSNSVNNVHNNCYNVNIPSLEKYNKKRGDFIKLINNFNSTLESKIDESTDEEEKKIFEKFISETKKLINDDIAIESLTKYKIYAVNKTIKLFDITKSYDKRIIPLLKQILTLLTENNKKNNKENLKKFNTEKQIVFGDYIQNKLRKK